MTNDKQRERLAELLIEANATVQRNGYNFNAMIVPDYLFANGVIAPPCMVGDTVYYLNKRPHIALSENTVYKAEVVRIVTTRLGTALVIQIKSEGCCEIPDVKDWGTAVFATKEEAEEALKGGVQG